MTSIHQSGGKCAEQTGRTLVEIEKILDLVKPDDVRGYGFNPGRVRRERLGGIPSPEAKQCFCNEVPQKRKWETTKL